MLAWDVRDSTRSKSKAQAAPATGGDLALARLTDRLGFHLRLAQIAFYRDFAAELAALDLTQRQSAVLELIQANERVSQVSLAATLSTDRATMMAIVDRLEARGFVRRERSKADRRRQELHLTEIGVEVVAQLDRSIQAHERHFTERFSASELAALFDALKRIHQQF